MALRMSLVNREIAAGKTAGVRELQTARLGDHVSDNAFTNYDSLRVLITKHNSSLGDEHRHLAVDDSIVEVRDAVAHGRVYRELDGSSLRLLKFTRPEGGKVTVAFACDMTPEWLQQQTTRVWRQILNVMRGSTVKWTIGDDPPTTRSQEDG